MLHITTKMAETENVQAEVKKYESWEEMDLPEDLLRGLFRHGFEKPSAIQSLATKPMAEGKDLLAQAQSGTGKTGAFVIPALMHVEPSLNYYQILIVSPTRELNRQIFLFIEKLTKNRNKHFLPPLPPSLPPSTPL